MFCSSVVIASVVVALKVLPASLDTIPDLECNILGGECVFVHQCIPESKVLSSLGSPSSCPGARVCCHHQRGTAEDPEERTGSRVVKALYLHPENKYNTRYNFDHTGDKEMVDTRIVNIELLNNTLSSAMDSTAKKPTTATTEGDNIVFPEQSGEDTGNSDRTEFLNMLYYKYTVQFKEHNMMKNNDESQKKKSKYAVGARSSKYCKLYERFTVNDPVLAMPLLPSLFPVFTQNHCSKPLPLIVGGTNATKGEFPHMAGLGYDRGEWIDFLCGGSLISERYVLTAAHCGNTKWGPPITVRLGTRNLITDNGQNMDVVQVLIHPNYHEPRGYNDIALVKIVAGVVLGKVLRPACLPHPNSPTGNPGRHLTATGWGKTGYGMFSSPNLQKVSLEVVNNKTCEELFLGGRRTERLPSGIADSMLCASGFMDSSRDTCQGDSGGPLQALTAHSKCMYEIVGITSFGKLCGTGLPAIYTRVSSYVAWIEDHVWPS